MSTIAKTSVVTGANSGIGLALSEALAREGHRVVLVGRDRARLDEAVGVVRRAGSPGVEHLGVRADLATIAGARALGEELLDRVPRIDVLVHNAGVLPTERVLTSEGFEVAFATNHVAPWVLNRVLLGRLRESAPARIVQVSAGLYVKGTVDREKSPVGLPFSAFATYGTSKLWNLYATRALSEELAGSGVTVNSVHPGVVRTRLGAMTGAKGLVLGLVKRLWKSPEVGAKGPLYLATARELEGVTGRYYNELDRAELGAVATDAAMGRVVMERTRELLAERGFSG